MNSLLNRVNRFKRLIELEAPAVIIESEKQLIRDAIDRFPRDEEAYEELQDRMRENREEMPRLIARAEQLYREAGNTVPWDDADATTQNEWYSKVVDEEYQTTPDKPDLNGMH